jgi:hypothetical protein
MTLDQDMTAGRRRSRAAFGNGVIWILGLVLCEIPVLEFLGGPADPDRAFSLHWFEFLFIGLATPVALAALPLIFRRGDRRAHIRDVLVVFVVAWIARFVLGAGRASALDGLVLELLVFAAVGSFRGMTRTDIAAVVLASAVGWIVMMTQGVEFDAAPLVFTRPLTWMQVLFLALIGVASYVFTGHRRLVSTASPRWWLAFGGAAVVALWLAFRLESYVIPYNWGFFVGPAQTIRQGGWLLWDVPSQYGFLNVLLIALIPFSLTWDSMRVLISAMVAASTMLAFSIFYVRRAGLFDGVFALLASIAFFSFEIGSSFNDSFFAYPSSGPLRFFWVYAALGALVGGYLNDSQRLKQRWRWLGYGAWIIGVLWSAESAIYVTCTWMPAIAVAAIVRTRLEHDGSWFAAIGAAAREGVTAATLLIASVAIIGCVYLAGIHHLPDWSGFIEFGLKYASGLVRYPADPYGSEWLVILELALIAATAIECVRARRFVALPLLIGLWGAVWATASYYLARSVNNNINALLSLAGLVIAVILLLADRDTPSTGLRIVRTALAPIAIWALVLAFGNSAGFARMRLPFMAGYPHGETGILHPVDPQLEHVVRIARLSPNDHVLYVGNWLALAPPFMFADGSVYEPLPWVPAASWDLVSQLPADRRDVYILRFRARHPMSGWILGYTPGLTCSDYVPDAVDGRSLRAGVWQLVYCRAPVVVVPSVPRPHPIQDAATTVYGSLDEIYFGNAPTYATVNAPVQVVAGRAFHVRGWLDQANGSPERERLVAAVDGRIVASAHYGSARPDTVAVMRARGVASSSAQVGFDVTVPTAHLRPGSHRLELLLASSKHLQTLVGSPVAFGIY